MRRQRSAAGAVSRPAIISCCSMHARTGRRHAHARSRTARPSCISCHMRAQAAAWLLMLIAWAALLRPAAASGDYAGYNPWNFNKACRYSASNIPAHLFKEGIDGGLDYLFPLETSRAVNKYEKPWEACFGPKETYSLAAVSAGWKLPCKYQINQQGNYDFQEEHACDVLLKSNCYCYALDRFVGSYCEPGLGGTGQAFELPVNDCSRAMAGVIADGGKVVDRNTVYSQPKPSKGHYIALAVKPPATPDDTGDFHFWRLDSNNAWSYKAGDTLVRNTLRNGTPIQDIENNDVARGVYKVFCGYFYVNPATHKLVGNQFWYSSLPSRFGQWRTHGIKGIVQPLPKLSAGWLAAYNDYFADNGWEDSPRPGSPQFMQSLARERAFAPRNGNSTGPQQQGPDGTAAAAAAALGGVGDAVGGVVGGAVQAVAAAAADAAWRIPHWYSVRPPQVLTGERW